MSSRHRTEWTRKSPGLSTFQSPAKKDDHLFFRIPNTLSLTHGEEKSGLESSNKCLQYSTSQVLPLKVMTPSEGWQRNSEHAQCNWNLKYVVRYRFASWKAIFVLAGTCARLCLCSDILSRVSSRLVNTLWTKTRICQDQTVTSCFFNPLLGFNSLPLPVADQPMHCLMYCLRVPVSISEPFLESCSRPIWTFGMRVIPLVLSNRRHHLWYMTSFHWERGLWLWGPISAWYTYLLQLRSSTTLCAPSQFPSWQPCLPSLHR